MPPEECEEARAWLTKAIRDLEASRYLADAEEPLLDIVVYHCQQAMEKALKGYLSLHSSPFGKTHALVPLLEQAIELDAGFEGLLEHAEDLSPFATRFRYPGDILEPDVGEASRALAMAAQAVSFVLDRVPEDVRPRAVAASEPAVELAKDPQRARS